MTAKSLGVAQVSAASHPGPGSTEMVVFSEKSLKRSGFRLVTLTNSPPNPHGKSPLEPRLESA